MVEGSPGLEVGMVRMLWKLPRPRVRRRLVELPRLAIGEMIEEMGVLVVRMGRALEKLPRLEARPGRVLELPRLEDGMYSEDDVVNEVSKILGEPAGGGCTCGPGRLSGSLRLTVGTTSDVWLPSNVGRTRTGFGKLGQEAAIRKKY